MSDAISLSRRALRQRLRAVSCPDCEYPWEEHAGSAEKDRTICGECQYEQDHGQLVEGRKTCWSTVPEAMFVPPTAQELKRAEPMRRRILPVFLSRLRGDM